MAMSVNAANDLLKKSVHKLHAELVLGINAEGELLRGIKDLLTQEEAAGFPDGVASIKAAIQDASAVVADVIARAARLKDQLDVLAG
jgi:hypothetical protein